MSIEDGSELFLYGIAEDSVSVAAMQLPQGVGGAPLSILSEQVSAHQRPLIALVSPLPARQTLTKPDVRELLAFEKAIASVHAVCDVLPARFGCVLASKQELLVHLREHRAAYRAALSRIAGCVEMGVRLELPPVAAPPASEPALSKPAASGADYLRARQAHHARLQQDQEQQRLRGEQLRDSFADLFREAQVQPNKVNETLALTAAFLVPRDQIEAFRTRFAAYKAESVERVILLGPWPPFSFSAISEIGGAR